MSQSNVVLAFRARLKKKGYFEVSVCRLNAQEVTHGSPIYRITCREPLAGHFIVKDMDIVDMFNWR